MRQTVLFQALGVVLLLLCLTHKSHAHDNDRSEAIKGLRSFFDSHLSFEAERIAKKKHWAKRRLSVSATGSSQRTSLALDAKTNEFSYLELFKIDSQTQLNIQVRGYVLPEFVRDGKIITDVPNEGVSSRTGMVLAEKPSNLLTFFTLMTGHLYGTELTIVELLNECKEWKEEEVVLNGIKCIEVTADHSSGSYSVAYSRSHNFAPLRIRVRKNGSHLFNGRRFLDDDIVGYFKEYSYTAFDPNFENVGFETKSIREFEDGSVKQLDQDFAWKISPLKKPIKLNYSIPEGSPVVILGLDQIDAEWRDGKIVKPYDVPFEEKLRSSRSHFEKSQVFQKKRHIGMYSFFALLGIGSVVYLLIRVRGWK